MRDGITPDSLAVFTGLLAPAEGLESPDALFSSPPIESLEWLKELGEIAHASFAPEAVPVAAQPETPAPAETHTQNTPSPAAPQKAATPKVTPTTPEKSSDARLVEALMEYHRLRSPTLGARSGVKPASGFQRVESSSVPNETSHFSSMEIPVVQNYVPKTSLNPHRSSQPIHTVLKSGPKKPTP